VEGLTCNWSGGFLAKVEHTGLCFSDELEARREIVSRGRKATASWPTRSFPRNAISIDSLEALQSAAGQMDRLQTQTRNSVEQQVQFQSFAPAFILLFGLLVVLAFAIVFFSSPARNLEGEPLQHDPCPERQPLLPDQNSSR